MREKKFNWESYHITDYNKNVIQKFKDDLDPEEDAEEIEELDQAQTILTTPVGIFLKDDSMNPLRRIEHWLCKTNFDLDSRVTALINSIEGVETLTIVTRYQMIVGFGELFKVKEVKKDIEETIRGIDEIPKTKLDRLVRKMYQETRLGGN